MIEIQNVKKSFDGKQILHGISAKFRQGEANMIIGASGTGKSVLLKSIVGLVPPDEGDILYHNRNFYKADRQEQKEIRREIGMLFQGSALFDSLTVEQNVRFPLDMLSNMSSSEKEDRVNLCLKRVELEHAGKKMPSEISGGMKKRVGIARAIVHNSQYLFCDEPNSGLDPNTAILIDNLIFEITKEYNLTTVIVSHDMNSMMEIGEHILFLHKGHLVWEGSNDEVLDATQPELETFIFSNNLMRKYKTLSK
ncbi:ATP-binding cassette domain-containing protein [Flammeovirgaceae bacterium SG7u.111]|nr:ATP-binding cassette domain-containing protein [Flammeovirgaceae bacterium SG7u.132]WPO33509.1 ATP-binding cassette domain-containing protein [Flammeovirgaceae bacterium SG7u.111]